jgi:hypothetical protein
MPIRPSPVEIVESEFELVRETFNWDAKCDVRFIRPRAQRIKPGFVDLTMRRAHTFRYRPPRVMMLA